MPRAILGPLQKLEKLEEKRKALVEERKVEILELINECNAFTVDDSLLAGFLLFVCNPQNSNHQILKDFRALAMNKKIPGKHGKTRMPRKSINKEAKKSN